MTWDWIALVVLIVAPIGTWGLGYHYGRNHGRSEGKHRRTADSLDRQWEDWRAQVAAPYEGPEIRAKTGPLPKTPGGAMMPGEIPGWSLSTVRSMKQRPPDHITAADLLAPVVLPRATDTGEIRALTAETDAWLAGMRQRGLIT